MFNEYALKDLQGTSQLNRKFLVRQVLPNKTHKKKQAVEEMKLRLEYSAAKEQEELKSKIDNHRVPGSKKVP